MSKFSMTILEMIEDPNIELKFNYKIWDEQYRETLDAMILNHFMLREICYKNPYRWLFEFNELLNRLMVDKYNKLFAINEKQDFNPLYNVDMTETFENETNVNGEGNTKNTATNVSQNIANNEDTNTDSNLSVMLQYPQDTMLASDLPSNVYANSGQRSNGNSKLESKINDTVTDNINDTVESTNKNTVIHKSTHKTLGSSAGLPFSKAMQQYKDYIEDFRLHDQLFDELEVKFLQIWLGEE